MMMILGRGSPLVKSLPNLSGPAGACKAWFFYAGWFFVCLWVNPHQNYGERCPHARVAVKGKEHWMVRCGNGVN
eukprot:1148196-Pelagomonas_calceolata.AAC.6